MSNFGVFTNSVETSRRSSMQFSPLCKTVIFLIPNFRWQSPGDQYEQSLKWDYGG